MYKELIKDLKIVCREKGITMKKIGVTGKKKEYPLFKIVINNIPKPKKTICFSAGIHGEEPAGPFSILEFLKQCDPKKFKTIKVIIFPVINPFGFDHGRRRNFLNKDLNGHFCKKVLLGENKIHYDILKKEKIFFFHALHEDEGHKRFYLYNFENKPEPIYRDIIVLAKKYFPIDTSNYIYDDPAKDGLIINRPDGSFEDRMFRDGVPYSMCTETPEAKPIKQRIALNVRIMKTVIKFSQKNNIYT